MIRCTSFFRTATLTLVLVVWPVDRAEAQIPYFGGASAGSAARGSSAGGTATRSRTLTFSGVDPGVVAGEIMPLIVQLDVLSLLPPPRSPALPDNSARVWLHVPPAAVVSFNGIRTLQVGEIRYFVTPPLVPGEQYGYKVRVRWMQGDRVMEEERNIQIHAGEQVWDDFIRP